MTQSKERQAFYKLSFWLSESEYELLIKRAANQNLSAYARSQLFSPQKQAGNGLNSKDAARILALLGKTRLHSNINQIAHAIHCGTVSFCDVTQANIREVRDDIKEIRQALSQITGKKV